MKQFKFYFFSLTSGLLCLLLIQYGCDKNEDIKNNIPVAAFSCDQTEINLGQSIQFTDLSKNNPTSWLWDFGGGETSTSQNPSHAYSTVGIYTVSLTATNSYGSSTETKTDHITVKSGEGDPRIITDYDGNVYDTIRIGNQVWIAENLKSAHYADGTPIPLVKDESAWNDLDSTDKAYCYYDNLFLKGKTYGALYTWAAAMNGSASSDYNPSGIQGVCPDGWHVPSNEEWIELEMYLGMSRAEADDLGLRGTDEGSKIAGNSVLWENGDLKNNIAFGTSGFQAIPGGQREYYGMFGFMNSYASFWSATGLLGSYAWTLGLSFDDSRVGRFGCIKSDGHSVRCIKDK